MDWLNIVEFFFRLSVTGWLICVSFYVFFEATKSKVLGDAAAVMFFASFTLSIISGLIATWALPI